MPPHRRCWREPCRDPISHRAASICPGQSRRRRRNHCCGKGSLAHRRAVQRACPSQAGDPSGFSALQENPAVPPCRCWRRFLTTGLRRLRSRCRRRARCAPASRPLVRFAEPHRHVVPYRSVRVGCRPTMPSSPRHTAAVPAWPLFRVGNPLFLALTALCGRDGAPACRRQSACVDAAKQGTSPFCGRYHSPRDDEQVRYSFTRRCPPRRGQGQPKT